MAPDTPDRLGSRGGPAGDGEPNTAVRQAVADVVMVDGRSLGQMPAAFDAFVLKQVATEIRNIKAEYRGVVPEESIDLVARQSLQNLANSKVPQFVPLFVGRFTRERLHELTGFRPRVKLNLLTR
jgi:hypothetical protein